MSLSNVLTLLIAAALLAAVWQLRQINVQLRSIANQSGSRDADSIHDATHPAFSVQQLRRARQRFEIEYRNQLRLEAELYESAEWHSRSERSALSSQVRERLRAVCEALVQCECAWKEYEWMVEGNISVAVGSESRTTVLQSFRDLLLHTRGTPVAMTVAPNSEKVRRVEEILANWAGRLAGTTAEALAIHIPSTTDEAFEIETEEKLRSLTLVRQ
ncbi:MAG: hypothetical protein ABIS30_02965 [Gallionella sp.]